MLDLPRPILIGVVHLPALPGSARSELPIEAIVERAVRDATALEQAGFSAMIVENFGDVPFAADRLPPPSLACMAVVAREVRAAVRCPVGVNALRNDAAAALGIAVASGATFIRVNVHTGVAATDQGIIEGRARETLLERQRLSADIAILADVFVKHARPLSERDIGQAAKDTAYRGLADGLIVTGPATGSAPDMDDVRRVRAAVPDRLLFAGSGVTAARVSSVLQSCDGVIVGTALREGTDTARPIDPRRAAEFVAAARGQVGS